MHRVVINSGAIYQLGNDEKFFQFIKEAGFGYYDYTLFWKGTTEHIGVGPDYKEKAKELRKLSDSYGLKCTQTHGYFTAGIDGDKVEIRTQYIKKEIEISSILGADSIVIHPICDYSLEENIKWIKENFLPLAEKFDIKLAIENVWDDKNHKIEPMCSSTPESFVKLLDAFDSPYVVACLDIGHAEIKQLGTSAVEMIDALGKRLFALHIHDNTTYHDDHQMPYTQKINFHNVLEALKRNKYEGDITFEVETCYNRGEDPTSALPFELYPAFIKLQYEIGKYFANYLEK